MNDKPALRQQFLARRNSLSEAERVRAGNLIRQRLFQHAWWRDAQTILTYVSFGSEVDTRVVLQEGIRYRKRMVVPIFDPAKPNDVELSELSRYGDLVPGLRPNLLEPRADARRPVQPGELDLILVPGAAFDESGNRLGFGGGYFDRLLDRSTNASSIGLAYSIQLTDVLPVQAHDIPVDLLITEKGVITPAPESAAS